MSQEPATRDRQRRSSSEIRDLILASARAEFAEKGYTGTTNRDIAHRAGVAMSVLYRNFETKADLFSDAVVEPFVVGVENLTEHWIEQVGDPLADEDLMQVFLSDVLSSMSHHQHVLEQLTLGRAELSEAMTNRIRTVFDRLFRQARLMAELEARRRGWFSPEDLDLPIRVLVCMVAGASAFGWFLLPEHAREPGAPNVLEAMTKIGLWGVSRKPRDTEPDQPDPDIRRHRAGFRSPGVG
jgi:AcrR family transcriptional regulator